MQWLDNGPIALHGDAIVLGACRKDHVAEICFLSSSDGAVIKSFQFERLDKPELDNHATAIRAIPATKGNKVVMFTNRAEVVCIDAPISGKGHPRQELKILWRRDLRKEYGVFKRDDFEHGTPGTSAVIVDDRVYCATRNGSTAGIERLYRGKAFVPAPGAPSYVCLSLTTGTTLWTSAAGSAKTVHSVSATPLPLPIDGTVKLLLCAGGDGILRGLTADDGLNVWESAGVWWSWQTPVENDENVFILTAVPPGTPKGESAGIACFVKDELYSADLIKRPKWVFSGPLYSGSMARARCKDGILFVLDESGRLLALDSKNGELLWFDDLGFEILRFVEMLVVGNKLLVPVGREIVAFDIDRTRRITHKTDVGLIISGGMECDGKHVYLSDGNGVFSFALQELLP